MYLVTFTIHNDENSSPIPFIPDQKRFQSEAFPEENTRLFTGCGVNVMFKI